MSMTVGIGSEWQTFPNGFPKQWNAVVNNLRANLPANIRLMYDVNYTDSIPNNKPSVGGELARWRYRIVEMKNSTDDTKRSEWQELVKLWNSLDAVGIDMYRSLTTKGSTLPTDYTALVAHLRMATDSFAGQLSDIQSSIAAVTGQSKPFNLKEVGFRSVENGFVDPFVYAGSGTLNIAHQAAAYEAVLQSFATGEGSLFRGIVFWDTSINPALHGPTDVGFSPLGKTMTENVLKHYFN